MISFHMWYLSLTLQAIIIIAKLSFWNNASLQPSVAQALYQYMQKGYIQKLKTDITADLLHCGHQDLVTLLYRQVTHIDGRSFIYSSTSPYEQFMAG